jgi:hypothetical protein
MEAARREREEAEKAMRKAKKAQQQLVDAEEVADGIWEAVQEACRSPALPSPHQLLTNLQPHPPLTAPTGGGGGCSGGGPAGRGQRQVRGTVVIHRLSVLDSGFGAVPVSSSGRFQAASGSFSTFRGRWLMAMRGVPWLSPRPAAIQAST